jgi:branched-chain amino acid transport system permease protein
VADDVTATALLGWSPEAVAAVNWALASVLAALAGVLAAPIVSLNPTTYSLLVVPALAAALAGGLSSFGGTVAAGLALGMVQSLLTDLAADVAWLGRPGVRDGLPFVLIVAAMALRGRRRGRPRWSGADQPAPARPPMPVSPRPARPVVAAAAGSAAVVLALFTLGPELRLALIQSLIGAVVCLSLVLLTGYSGQISLAQMALAGVAGFALSRLATDAGVAFPVAPLLAALAAGAVGALLGLPALRLRGVDLALVTLAGAVAVEELVFKDPLVTGGVGGSPVPDPRLLGLDLGIGGPGAQNHPRAVFGLLVLAVLVAIGLALARLRRGRHGRRLLAVRANERAAAASGVNVAATKLSAFIASAFVAGLGGALLAYAQGRVSFASFGIFVSLAYLAVTYLGGIARIAGALVGAALVGGGLLVTAADRLASLGRYQLLATGLGLVAVAVRFPDGLAAAVARRTPVP